METDVPEIKIIQYGSPISPILTEITVLFQITHLYNKFPSARHYEAYVGEINLEDDSDTNDPWREERNSSVVEGIVERSGREITVPEFQVRAAFYDFWN